MLNPPQSAKAKPATRNQCVDAMMKGQRDEDKAPNVENNEILMAIERSAKEVRADIVTLSDHVTKQLTEIKTDIDELKEKTKDLEKNVEFQEAETRDRFEALEERITTMEYHSRKDNLIFKGLVKTKHGEEEGAVKKFIKDKLEIRTDPQFVNVHSLDSNSDRPQLIICRFQRWNDREACVFAARQKLKGTEFSVVMDLPTALRMQRTKLLKDCRKIRAEGKMQARVIEKGVKIVLQTRKTSTEPWKTKID